MKWMYSIEKELYMPYQDNLQSLMNAEDLEKLLDTIFGNEWITSEDAGIMLHIITRS